MLKCFVRDRVWIGEQPLRFHGIPVGARMTVVRLGSGGLWVHSPIAPVEPLRVALETLGPVRQIVAPCHCHHLYVPAFREAYPGAVVHVSPNLPRKRPDLPADHVLGDSPDPAWAGEIEQLPVRGHRSLDEVVFFHRASRTLIVADLLESASADCPWSARIAGRIAGVYGRPGPPIEMKRGFTDRAAACATIQRILDWDFDRIILAHGQVIEGSARTRFTQAFRFLM